MNRRTFLETSASASVVATLPAWQWRSGPPRRRMLPPTDAITLRDPRVNTLARTALAAAHQAGASYADVRMSYTTSRRFLDARPIGVVIKLGLSVRALVDGYWGWAATPSLSTSEALRAGHEAVRLAQGNRREGKHRPIEWGTIPLVQDGTWTTPIRIDPFEVATEEICDWMEGLSQFIHDLAQFRGGTGGMSRNEIQFTRIERVFASTEGSYQTQTQYVTQNKVDFGYRHRQGSVVLRPAQGGWEYVLDAQIRDRVREEMDRMDHQKPLPLKSTLDVGRYDIVFSAATMADLLAATLASATEVDRALGYEANAGGTSYLGPDPLVYLGTTVASPLVTITADRSAPKGLATIGWDDDGVAPEDFTLVTHGTLVDYQTTREQAAWLTPWYQKRGTPVRSHGCAASADALSYPMQHIPNLTLQPGTTPLSVENIIADLAQGLVVDGMDIQMDFQHLNGFGRIGGRQFGTIYEVRNGQRVAQFDPNTVSKGLLFRAPELWTGVLALGGPASLETNFVGRSTKGEPENDTVYSIAAVPALIKQLAVIDPLRKV